MRIQRFFRSLPAKKANHRNKDFSTNHSTTTNHPQTTTSCPPAHFATRLCQYWLIVANLLLILNPISADWLMECGSCHCKWNSGKKTADCKNLTLSEVPENLSPHIQVLDLSHNSIPYLPPNAFLHAQLHNLHKLYIRNASLQQIDKRSFAQLEILIELDLSHNQLSTLQVNQFAHLVKVRALLLNSNHIETLGNGVFQHLKFLHRLELKNNRISHIATEVFVNLPMLSQIYLDENQLSFLRKATFEHLKRLTALSLDQNPWNCTCELESFRDFVLQRNLYTPPTSCFHPIQFRGMLWIDNQPEAFACKPRIVEPLRGATITASNDNVTLVCCVHASSNTHVAWHHNKQLIRNGNQRFHIQLRRDGKISSQDGSEGGRHLFTSRLTIAAVSRRDEGAYTCLAENAGGQDAVQMTLLVQSTTTNALWFSFQGNLSIVICLMALSLLSITFFATMVFCCLYKRYKYNASSSGGGVGGQRHQQQHQQQQPHLDIQLTMAGNVVVDSTSINASSIESSSNESAKTASPVGSHYHLVRENTNANIGSNNTSKKFTACLLQQNSGGGQTSGNANHHFIHANQNGGGGGISSGGCGGGGGGIVGAGSPLKYQTKDPAQIQPLNDVAVASRLKNKLISNSCSTAQREFSAVVDFQPDLLSAYNSKTGKINS